MINLAEGSTLAPAMVYKKTKNRRKEMKRLGMLLVVASFGLVFLLKPAYAVEKFGYADFSRLFSEYNKTKDYDKTLADKENKYNDEREKKIKDLKQLEDKFNLLSDKEKETKKGELETKVKSLQDYDRQNQMDLRKEQDEKMKEIFKNIDDAVKQYAEKSGYTFIFNDRFLLYQHKSYDITDKILEILNKNYTKK